MISDQTTMLSGNFRSLFLPRIRNDKPQQGIDFAFIFHPRDVSDIARKYPWVSLLPERIVKGAFDCLQPLPVSLITGITAKNGKSLRGVQIAVPSTPELLLRNRRRSRERILAAVRLAEQMGAKIVGLGALSSTLTNRGRMIVSEELTCKVTTGHSLTAAVVIETAKKAALHRGICFGNAVVAIVGACGSIGSASARWLAGENVRSLILHDTSEKALHRLKDRLSFQTGVIETSTELESISAADVIIAATNVPRQFIEAHHLKPGAIIIDDAQPPNVSASIAADSRFLLAWGGLVEIPGVNTNFDVGLIGPHTAFSCLGEIITLAVHGIHDNYTIGPVDVTKAKRLFSLASDVGINVAPLQAFGQLTEWSRGD